MNITNIVDVLIVLTVAWFGVIGFKRGLFKQLVSTVGFIIVIVLAFYLKNPVAEFLSMFLPFFKFGGVYAGVTALNILLYQLIAFLLVLSILLAILNFLIRITGIVETILKFTVILAIPSKIGGLIIGLVTGFIVVFVALFFLNQPALNISGFENSKLTSKILGNFPVLSSLSKGIVNTVDDITALGTKYKAGGVDPNEFNKEAIDVMLKHKVVTPNYVMKLVDKGKINIHGIDTVVNKYR